MFVDAHVHLDHEALHNFSNMIIKCESSFSFFTNSVDYQSSLVNIDLSKRNRSIKPFVGIHPEVFSKSVSAAMARSELDRMIEKVAALFPAASGIGEIGLDDKYGSSEEQKYLLSSLLKLAESTNLPISFHCRDSIRRILDVISSYRIRGNILFHWFAGSESELSEVHDRGIYTSFGPSIIFSKRMSALVGASSQNLILAETDSPTSYRSLLERTSTPFLVTSVIFKMCLTRKISFDSMAETVASNSIAYLGTQD